MRLDRLRNLFLAGVAIASIAETTFHTKGVWVEDINGGCQSVVFRTNLDDILGKYAGVTLPLPLRNSVIFLAKKEATNRELYLHELGHATRYCADPIWTLRYYQDPKAREDDADSLKAQYRYKLLVGDNQ